MSDPTTTVYTVTGMTCGHCVASVTDEVTEVPGVTAVHVDLADGLLRVTGDASPDAVRSAVQEAGYELARRSWSPPGGWTPSCSTRPAPSPPPG